MATRAAKPRIASAFSGASGAASASAATPSMRRRSFLK
jgi:hypothetical protein